MCSHAVQVPPLLLRNIVPRHFFTHLPQVTLSPTPHGSIPPTVPTARTVTVARLASPLSVDRVFQTSCVHGLHAYFMESVRLMKRGDMIAVALDADSVYANTGQGEDTSDVGGPETENQRYDIMYNLTASTELLVKLPLHQRNRVFRSDQYGIRSCTIGFAC